MIENEIQTHKNTAENLEQSFLAAYQTLDFTKEDKKNNQVADVLRRYLFTKYVTFKNT